MYNLLPAGIVNDTEDVHIFQAKLQSLMKVQATFYPTWETLYSPRHALHAHPLARLINGASSIMGEDDYVQECVTGIHPMAMDGNEDLPPAWW